MGEARRRGSEADRRREAIRRQKAEFVRRMGGADERGLALLRAGLQVECVEEGAAKSADLIVRRGNRELFVECKRLSRKTAYAETERQQFLRLWDRAKHVLLQNRQWVWFKGTFHVDPSELPDDFLTEVYRAALPIGTGERLVHDSERATIHARLIDSAAVRGHMEKFRVKANSPMESRLLGGDWAPENAAVTMIHMVQTSHVADCEAPILGTYIEEIGFACGFTRNFDSAVSIDKKARDITKLLSKAVEQVPDDKPSIIHIAAETMEGIEVERRRTEKIFAQIPGFITNKPVLAIRFHRLQGHQRVEKLYEMDETVDKFQIDGVRLHDLPPCVVVPAGTVMQRGSHWEIYR